MTMLKPERKLFSLYLTVEEREKLQRLAERDGYNEVAPWLRRIIRQGDDTSVNQQVKDQSKV
jgi:hypothetical protein